MLDLYSVLWLALAVIKKGVVWVSKYSDFWFDNRRTSLVDDLLSDDDKPVKKGKDHIALAGH